MIIAAFAGFLFFLAALICLFRGIGMAFACVYVPALLMLSNTAPVNLSGLPNISAPMAATAGIMFAFVLKGGEPLRIRWSLMDTVVCLLALFATISAGVNGNYYTAVHFIGAQSLEFVLPYMFARVMFNTPAARRAALVSIIACACVIVLFAPIEMRLWPYYYTRVMTHIFPRDIPITKALTRFGFFRAAVSFVHPIDFGNGCIIITGLIAVLATSTGIGLRNVYVQAGLAAGLISMGTSLSFGPFFGFAFTMLVVLALIYMPFSRRVLVLAVLATIVALCLMTWMLMYVQTNVNRYSEAPLIVSFRIRALIVQNCWPFVRSAGMWGYGEKITQQALNLKSVDNTYMLWCMTRGWGYTILWISIPVIAAIRAQRALRRARNVTEVLALAITIATLLGINLAMFTVWAGSVYAKVWLVLVGFSVSLTEWFLAQPAPRKNIATLVGARRRGRVAVS